MHLLVLGGTRFVGRAVVDRALDAGAEVTLFNRGRTAPGLYPHVETVLGDRTADLSALAGRHFDAVIDCAAYDPAVVALSTGVLTADRYVFVSSVSVYADQSVPPVEGAALLGDDSYGGRKAACEGVVLERFGDGALIARPGLIVGPHDPTERFSYWPRRFRRPGPVLAPGDPNDPMQFTDVRDLAGFLVAGASGELAAGGAPVFNVVGSPLPMADLLAACRTAAGGNQDLVWMSTTELRNAGVDPWMGVPLWIGDPDWSAANLVDNTRALAAGLTLHPVAETVTAVDEWNATREATEPLSPEEERRLLEGR
ncbi:NAD-dependent epimerase/dehydratase family protein [Actinoplanes sp. TBRC 11911]|uniref:NAD-dependent epimerase/dehydratase family protein n=1 Tax=Actinoplanes sp. TBRC 11911 TaxID=2729386 RepID=UPI00145C4B31|nr:NAD-dependent epimerase/dehydratase family protein [Actinoplanes sp. TBRC 11911]NMO53193.1 NAD-dependent epimerase/dehydratase family protein [Actinoplanes sp. TBRC 11911]